MTVLVQISMLVCCGVILARADKAVSCMCGNTRLPVRVGYWALAMGAVAQLGMIVLYGDVPSVPALVLAVGAAVLLVTERRARVRPAGREGRRRARGA